MANDSVGVAAAASPTNYIDNEQIATGGSPANVDRQRVRIGGSGYADLGDVQQGDSGQNLLITGGGRKEASFTTTTNQALISTDVSNYRYVVVHLTSISGTLTAQGSNNNSNWVSLPTFWVDANSFSGAAAASLSLANKLYAIPLTTRYFRLNQTGIGGTTAGVAEFYSVPPALPAQYVYIGGPSQLDIEATSLSGDGATVFQGSVSAFNGLYNGSTWDRQRGPAIFKTATATASGDTALWTPTSGKKFRLMRFKIEATADAATSGGASIDVVLRDSTTATAAAMSFYAPATSVTTTPGRISSGWVDLGNGLLSAAANNVLNINLSAALTSGKVRVVCCGTEE